MSEPVALNQYRSADGFLDIPKIISDDRVHDLFPGILENIKEIRTKDFPSLESSNRVYLDSAATSQEPLSVTRQIFEYRSKNIRGSSHSKNSAEARNIHEKIEESRKKITEFFNAHNYLAVFTGGTTDSSNFIATNFLFKKMIL